MVYMGLQAQMEECSKEIKGLKKQLEDLVLETESTTYPRTHPIVS